MNLRPDHASSSRPSQRDRNAPDPVWRTILEAATIAFVLAATGAAQVPASYYASVDTTNGVTLRSTLHAVIDDHTRFPYTSSATDTWNILELADEQTGNPANVLDVYQNESHPKQGAGNAFYDREHSWPNSYGFPNDGATNYPFSDCHMLFLCDSSYNSSRGNKPYRACASACTEKATVANNGQGGGSGSYPGQSNWTSGSGPSGSWETWIGRRGDVARAILYADVRYEGGAHGVTGIAEPNLIATDSETLIAASNTGSNESVAYMGMLSVLLAWNEQDPPDDRERHRNDVIMSFQGNRNPFIDHPEWARCIFTGTCSASQPICAGDGTLVVACPCANTGGAGRGCSNSVNAAGALLTTSGATNPDSVVLHASGMPSVATTASIFLQGDVLAVGGLVFGDGVRCADGNLIRIGSKPTPGGLAQYPELGNASVSTRGLVSPGSAVSRYYQAYYRNSAAAFCPPATFNVTNGLVVVW
ncbi:MAG: endonuclease [Planctomycetes bacterium]|nr:endonuclease [Planctomycetota bacterium]